MPKHILIVDDQDDLLTIMRSALEHEGYRVSQASGGEAALAVVADEVPDLIVSDVMMPDLDGVEMVQIMRRDRRLVGVPVVFLTAATTEEVEERARAVGVEGFMAKPFNARRLLAMVRGTLERFSQLRDATGPAQAAHPASVPTPRIAPDLTASGIAPLDALTGGIAERRVYYVTGDVGTGKGVLGVQWLHHVLVRGEGAVLVTTDRPSVVLRLAAGVGLDLQPYLAAGTLALLELDGDIERLVEAPEDLRLMAREIGRYAGEVKATRLLASSVLTLLCGSGRLSLTSGTVSGFLRDLEETGVSTVLIGDHPVTEAERTADAFLRRTVFGALHLAPAKDGGDVRVMTAERLLSGSVDAAGRRYRIERGTGLVLMAEATAEPKGPSLEDIRSHIDATLDEVRAGGCGGLVTYRDGEARVRDAWALAVRECAKEVLRTQQRCAVLVAQLDGPAPAGEMEAALGSLWDPDRHLPCWLGNDEVVVFGVGADREGMETLAQRIKGRVDTLTGERGASPHEVRCAVAGFAPNTSLPDGEIEILRRVSARPGASSAA